MIRRDEERNLQQQRDGTLQGVERMIVHLAVVGGQQHILLVPLEGPLDVIHPVLHGVLPVAFFLLHQIRPAIERQDEEADHDTHADDRQPRIVQHPVHHCEDDFNHQLQRHDNQLIQECQHVVSF